MTLNLKFAESIIIKPANTNTLKLETQFTYDSEELLQVHNQQVEQSSGVLRINTDYKESLMKQNDLYCFSCQEKSYTADPCRCFKISFVIYAPENVQLNLETISADIEVLNYKGDVNAKTISGFLDYSLDAKTGTDLLFKSVTGEIYTDFDINLDRKSTAYSKSVKTEINGGGASICLETVSGDIFFRKN